MSLSIYQYDEDFFIDAANVLKAVRLINGGLKMSYDETPEGLRSALDDQLWTIRFTNDGDVEGITFEGENHQEEIFDLFKTIAPAVHPGSYIQMFDEDGEHWRWVFDGETCKGIDGKIVFPEREEE